MTYRDRRYARADRLEEWAEKRRARGEAELAQSREMLDAIPPGQPILVDHYSAGRDRRYRDRAWNKMGRGVENVRKADDMESRAAGIRAAADHAIYDDDPDAIEQLRARIADLEAERKRITDYNKSCRKAAKSGGTGDLSILDDKQREDIARLARVCAYQVRPGGGFPSYKSSNLSGNIKRYRDRLALLEG